MVRHDHLLSGRGVAPFLVTAGLPGQGEMVILESPDNLIGSQTRHTMFEMSEGVR